MKENIVMRKEKLALGLLASLFVTPAILAGNTGTDKPKTISSQVNDLNRHTTNETPSQPSEAKEADVKLEGLSVAIKGKETTGSMSDAQLEKKLTDILNKNPEIIVAALQKFNQNQQRAQQERLKASLMKYQGEISKESSAVVLGKNNAEVKLVVWLDPNCPHCRSFSQALHKAHESFPNVAIIVRHWAILGNDSEEVIRGLWAIKQQGSDHFNAATKAIASSEERYTFAKLLSWAKDRKLDVAKFEADAESQATKDIVAETKKLASDIGLEGTPTSLLIDKKGIRLVVPTDEKSLESILTAATQA
jgi:protein-disulfide isomerase